MTGQVATLSTCGSIPEGFRELIEAPGQTATLWGQRRSITPRLCSKVFGDGQLVLTFTPLNTRPESYTILVDSSLWIGDPKAGHDDEADLFGLIDVGTDTDEAIIDVLEDEYGRAWRVDEDDEDACKDHCGECEWCEGQVWPMVNIDSGWAFGIWGTIDEVTAQLEAEALGRTAAELGQDRDSPDTIARELRGSWYDGFDDVVATRELAKEAAA